MKSMYKHIFEPLTIRRMTMKNRIMMTPMGTNYGEQSGEMSFLHINYYEQRARGGTGLIMVENANVDYPLGSNGTTQLRIDHDNYLPRLFKLTETVHKHGACIGIQINHAGASAQSARTQMQPVSASDIPSKADRLPGSSILGQSRNRSTSARSVQQLPVCCPIPQMDRTPSHPVQCC